LCSAVFGRGVDFICLDDKVKNNGGVEVIQTFLSVSINEEIQIKGHTARQSQEGSYQLVLALPHLAVFNFTMINCMQGSPMFALLDKQRKAYYEAQSNGREAAVASSQKHDSRSWQYLEKLIHHKGRQVGNDIPSLLPIGIFARQVKDEIHKRKLIAKTCALGKLTYGRVKYK